MTRLTHLTMIAAFLMILIGCGTYDDGDFAAVEAEQANDDQDPQMVSDIAPAVWQTMIRNHNANPDDPDGLYDPIEEPTQNNGELPQGVLVPTTNNGNPAGPNDPDGIDDPIIGEPTQNNGEMLERAAELTTDNSQLLDEELVPTQHPGNPDASWVSPDLSSDNADDVEPTQNNGEMLDEEEVPTQYRLVPGSYWVSPDISHQ